MILLDFDGVLFYTHDEAFYCAYTAAHNLLPEDVVFLKDEFDEEKTLFEKYRYLIGDAWHCRHLIRAIDAHIASPVNLDILTFFTTSAYFKSHEDYIYEDLFYDVRRTFKNSHLDFWISTIKPTPFFNELKTFLQTGTYKIISTKDESSISSILSYNGVSNDNCHIIGKFVFAEFDECKGQVIKQLLEFSNIKKQKVLMIDDHIHHLEDISMVCKDYNMELLEADWGYTKEHKKTEFNDKVELVDSTQALNILKQYNI